MAHLLRTQASESVVQVFSSCHGTQLATHCLKFVCDLFLKPQL
jgi:hypothetical protein